MFQQFKNIDSAFRHIRWFSLVFLIATTVVGCYAIFSSYVYRDQARQWVYIISDGKAIQAFRSTRKDNIPVEGRRHIKDFHQYFFNLSPDDKAIEANMKRAMYLADRSAKKAYDDLKENGYFTGMISANISQELRIDSVVLHTADHPYYFRFYGRLRILRPLSLTIRTLITQGYLRDLQERSDNNPNGFLIERWEILENKDIETKKR